MSIKFACSCGKAYKVPEKYAGRRIKCKECDEAIRVPSESEGGVASQRASAVSKRSVLTSQRMSGKMAAASSTSSRRSRSSTSGRSAAASSRQRVGTGTERFQVPDLEAGGKLKVYSRKKAQDDETFSRGEGRLTYFEEGKPKKAFRLGKDPVEVGRADACKITIPVASVSSRHMRLEYKLGSFIATDLQSQNGLTVNGRPIRRTALKDGDIIQLGEAVLRLDC